MLTHLLAKIGQQLRLVGNPQQLLRSLGLASQMSFLPNAEYHDLVESDRFWRLESKDTDPVELSCQ